MFDSNGTSFALQVCDLIAVEVESRGRDGHFVFQLDFCEVFGRFKRFKSGLGLLVLVVDLAWENRIAPCGFIKSCDTQLVLGRVDECFD